MGADSSPRRDAIRAAGGLLWRRTPAGWEIALVHRRRYDDWTLPKGKLDGDETWLDAALREVREETGFTARVLGFAGAVAYETRQIPKLVRFWHMEAVGEPAAFHAEEISEVVWMPVETARARLDYALEQALLEVWESPEGG